MTINLTNNFDEFNHSPKLTNEYLYNDETGWIYEYVNVEVAFECVGRILVRTSDVLASDRYL